MKRRWTRKSDTVFPRDTDTVTERAEYIDIYRDGKLIVTIARELMVCVETF